MKVKFVDGTTIPIQTASDEYRLQHDIQEKRVLALFCDDTIEYDLGLLKELLTEENVATVEIIPENRPSVFVAGSHVQSLIRRISNSSSDVFIEIVVKTDDAE